MHASSSGLQKLLPQLGMNDTLGLLFLYVWGSSNNCRMGQELSDTKC